MAAVDDVDQLIEQYHLAVNEFLKGNPEPVVELWSRRDDVTLTNPYGSVAHGWEQVVEASEQAASTRACLQNHDAGTLVAWHEEI
jgi:hypothetical protein